MAAVYVHLSGRDEEQHEESVMKLKECFRCSKTNEPSAKFCSGCGSMLDKGEDEGICTQPSYIVKFYLCK